MPAMGAAAAVAAMAQTTADGAAAVGAGAMRRAWGLAVLAVVMRAPWLCWLSCAAS